MTFSLENVMIVMILSWYNYINDISLIFSCQPD